MFLIPAFYEAEVDTPVPCIFKPNEPDTPCLREDLDFTKSLSETDFGDVPIT